MVVSIPLYSLFTTIKKDIAIQKNLSNLEFYVGRHHVRLTHIELLNRVKKDAIRCEVISTGNIQ